MLVHIEKQGIVGKTEGLSIVKAESETPRNVQSKEDREASTMAGRGTGLHAGSLTPDTRLPGTPGGTRDTPQGRPQSKRQPSEMHLN